MAQHQFFTTFHLASHRVQSLDQYYFNYMLMTYLMYANSKLLYLQMIQIYTWTTLISKRFNYR